MLLYIVVSVAAGAAVATLTFLFAVLFELVIERAAKILERPNLEWLVKLFAFLALLIGFQFDLLAS